MTRLIDITGKAMSGEWGTDDETGKGIPVLRTTNFTNEGIVSFENVVTRTIAKKAIADKFLRPGDIILEKSGGSDKQPVGRVIYFDGPSDTYLFNNFTGVLRIRDQKKWYPRYVFYSLFSNYRKGGTRAYENKTTGLHNLKTDAYVSSYEIADASYFRQKEICNHLDIISRIIRLRQCELRRFDELIKARFVEMFGDPKSNPNGYEKEELRSSCTVITGNTPPRSVKEYYGDYIEWIKTDNIVSGRTNPTHAVESLSKEGMKAGRIVDENAILMACIAGSIASIGKVCITDWKTCIILTSPLPISLFILKGALSHFQKDLAKWIISSANFMMQQKYM